MHSNQVCRTFGVGVSEMVNRHSIPFIFVVIVAKRLSQCKVVSLIEIVQRISQICDLTHSRRNLLVCRVAKVQRVHLNVLSIVITRRGVTLDVFLL